MMNRAVNEEESSQAAAVPSHQDSSSSSLGGIEVSPQPTPIRETTTSGQVRGRRGASDIVGRIDLACRVESNYVIPTSLLMACGSVYGFVLSKQ